MFTVIQFHLLKFLQQQLRIRLHYSIGTDIPCFSFCAEVGIIQIVITIIHQIRFERSSANSLNIFRYKSQKDIQNISTTHFWLTVNRYLRFGQVLHFTIFLNRIRNRRTYLLLLRFLRSCLRHRPGHIIIIRINYYALTHGHRNIKAIGIFHQYNIFPPESFHDSSADFIEETYFITNFHHIIYNLAIYNL